MGALSLVRGPVRRLAPACTVRCGFAPGTAQHVGGCFAAVRAGGGQSRRVSGSRGSPRAGRGCGGRGGRWLSLGVAHDVTWSSQSQQHSHCELLALLDLCVIPKRLPSVTTQPPKFRRSVDMERSRLLRGGQTHRQRLLRCSHRTALRVPRLQSQPDRGTGCGSISVSAELHRTTRPGMSWRIQSVHNDR